jgi:regulator of sigma E protease
MKGDISDFADDDTVPKGEPGEFMSASVWKRVIVIAAGPIMNFVAAIFLFFIMIWAWGQLETRPNSTEVGAVIPDTPALHAGLKGGDKIIAVDGNIFEDFESMAAYIRGKPDRDIVIKYRRDDIDNLVTVRTGRLDYVDSLGVERSRGYVGIEPLFDFHSTSFGEALRRAPRAAIFITALTLESLWKLITGQESVKNLGGPIMIAEYAGKAMNQGLPYLFNLAAVLSINLGILNILPIPVLDGGHLVFLSLEAIRRKPIPFKKRLFWQQVGMGLLLLLMVIVTYNDIARLITGG